MPLILEDDYDGEYRYDRQPVGALQSLDPERVVYFGSASKSLAPGLRIAWMVLPEDLVPEILSAKGNVDWTSATEQLTLAEFIASGHYCYRQLPAPCDCATGVVGTRWSKPSHGERHGSG